MPGKLTCDDDLCGVERVVERERERERESQKKGNFRDENGELW